MNKYMFKVTNKDNWAKAMYTFLVSLLLTLNLYLSNGFLFNFLIKMGQNFDELGSINELPRNS